MGKNNADDIVHEIWEGMRKVGEKYNLSGTDLAEYTMCVAKLLKLVDEKGEEAFEIIENMKDLKELLND